MVLSRKSPGSCRIALPEQPRATSRLCKLEPPVHYEQCVHPTKAERRRPHLHSSYESTQRSGEQNGKTLDLAQRMIWKLEALDSEFRTYHYALVDLVNNEDVATADGAEDTE